MLNLRPDSRSGEAGKSRWYDPGRDLAYITPRIIDIALAQLETPTTDLARRLIAGYPPRRCTQAAVALGTFVTLVHDEPDRVRALERSGLLECAPDALGVIGSLTLIVVLGWFHAGYGRVTMHGDAPPPEVEHYAENVAEILKTWEWQRRNYWWRHLPRRCVLEVGRLYELLCTALRWVTSAVSAPVSRMLSGH